jgi:hypothetical protein
MGPAESTRPRGDLGLDDHHVRAVRSVVPAVGRDVRGGDGHRQDRLGQLVSWVENGKAPGALNGVVRNPSTGAVTATRPMCMYPNVAVYNGHGSTTEASSFSCRRSRAETEE